MKNRIICFFLLTFFLIGIPIHRAQAATQLDYILITELDYPVAGQLPDTQVSISPEGCSVHSIAWYDVTEGKYIADSDRILAGHIYECVIQLQAEDGFVFASLPNNSPNIVISINNTSTSSIQVPDHNVETMIESRTAFPAVPEIGWIHSIDLNPPAPEAGQVPTYTDCSETAFHCVTLPGTEFYTENGVSWKENYETLPLNDSVFAIDNIYTYCLTITPNPGYAFIYDTVVSIHGNTPSAYLTQEEGIGNVMHISYHFPTLAEPEPSPTEPSDPPVTPSPYGLSQWEILLICVIILVAGAGIAIWFKKKKTAKS